MRFYVGSSSSSSASDYGVFIVTCGLGLGTISTARDDRRGIEVGGMGPQKIMIRRLIIIIIIQFKLFWGLSHLCDFHFSRFWASQRIVYGPPL